ncbi:MULTISPECIES: bis(5'-nucleosyl)-tetraphosphatase (symmetrical) YqeK [unclassified Jeotgalibaca]|uniref:bis(5'-nucleosyl)-tetraphosphatase (symmetrical) YqeK n=1 Tax=unclassified Jeotgalibaca TaxID=2621505 RepID=UPI003FCFC646
MTNRYTNWEREALLEAVFKRVKKSRYAHILRVEEKAIALAEQYGADVEACQLAALLHDYAKDMQREEIEEIKKNAKIDEEMLAFGSEIWHGPAGAYFAKETFGIKNPEVLEAIYQHTIGGVEMSLVGKVLFIADYIEEGRTFPGVERARELAETNLDAAALYKIKQTLIHLVNQEKLIYPGTLTVYNQWVQKMEG